MLKKPTWRPYLYKTINNIPLCLQPTRSKASASTVAARTGAAVYEESRESLRSGEVKTKVRKRLAIDPDVDEVDLENYQGVLGRPGVDFPVLTGIPKTNFTCKDYGNGYFADLETDCQVIF